MYNADCLYVGIRFSHESIDASLPDQFFLGSGRGLVCCDNGSPSLLTPDAVFRLRASRLSLGLYSDGS